MKRILFITTILSGIFGCKANTPSNDHETKVVFGEDGRQLANINLEKIGRVINDDGTFCSAFMVSDHIGLSSFDCFKATNLERPFLPNNSREEYTAKSLSYWESDEDSFTMFESDDYKNSRIENIFLSQRRVYWGISSQVQEGDAIRIFSSSATEPRAKYQDCVVEKLSRDTIYHKCDTQTGGQGGPILKKGFDARWVIIGINGLHAKDLLSASSRPNVVAEDFPRLNSGLRFTEEHVQMIKQRIESAATWW